MTKSSIGYTLIPYDRFFQNTEKTRCFICIQGSFITLSHEKTISVISRFLGQILIYFFIHVQLVLILYIRQLPRGQSQTHRTNFTLNLNTCSTINPILDVEVSLDRAQGELKSTKIHVTKVYLLRNHLVLKLSNTTKNFFNI